MVIKVIETLQSHRFAPPTATREQRIMLCCSIIVPAMPRIACRSSALRSERCIAVRFNCFVCTSFFHWHSPHKVDLTECPHSLPFYMWRA